MKRSCITLVCLLLLLNACHNNETKEREFNEIFPPQKIHTAALFRINGLNLSSHYFQEQKTAVKLVESHCDESCMSVLYQFDNAPHQSLLFFNSPKVNREHLSDLADRFKNVAITVGSTARSTDHFTSSFEITSKPDTQPQNRIYLVNQQGEVSGWIEDEKYSTDLLDGLDY